MDPQQAVRIIFVLSSALCATVAVSRPWWSDFIQQAHCATPGEVTCSSDCSKVMVCLGIQGDYNPTEIMDCSEISSMRCSAQKKQCVAAAESDCQPAAPTFTCNSVGSFPDPYNCKVFHVCFTVGSQAVTGNCSGETEAYNPLTADCTLTTSDRVCTDGPIKTCNESLQMGVVPENPAIYYVCMPGEDGLYPEMYRCPSGLVFDVTLFGCVESSATSAPTSPAQTASAPTQTASAPTQTASPPTQTPTPHPTVPPSQGGKCSTPGEIVADPDNCRSYYSCKGETWLHVDCIKGFYFDTKINSCAYGSCPASRVLELLKHF